MTVIDATMLGAPPVGLLEKSRDHVVNTAYFGSSHYDVYQMLDGISHFVGSVGYDEIVLQ